MISIDVPALGNGNPVQTIIASDLMISALSNDTIFFCSSNEDIELSRCRISRLIDPMRRDMRHLESSMSSFEEQKKIVSLDKADIIKSDAMIVWTGLPFPSAGTSMEIIYAFERGKYVITVNPREV